MADGLIRRQRIEDRGQRFCRGIAVQFLEVRRVAARNLLPSVVFCLLSSVLCSLEAEELTDPTRPPALITAPVPASGVEAAPAPAGLQSIIISKARRAAIINGETVELGGKQGDAKLIQVNEGSVVLRGAQGLQVMTLFPDVKITARQEAKIMQQLPTGNVQSGKQKNRPAKHKEEK